MLAMLNFFTEDMCRQHLTSRHAWMRVSDRQISRATTAWQLRCRRRSSRSARRSPRPPPPQAAPDLSTRIFPLKLKCKHSIMQDLQPHQSGHLGDSVAPGTYHKCVAHRGRPAWNRSPQLPVLAAPHPRAPPPPVSPAASPPSRPARTLLPSTLMTLPNEMYRPRFQALAALGLTTVDLQLGEGYLLDLLAGDVHHHKFVKGDFSQPAATLLRGVTTSADSVRARRV